MTMKPVPSSLLVMSLLTVLGGFAALVTRSNSVVRAEAAASERWNPRAAAGYLDSRESWWQGWDHANRDHGTKCVSCHTQATYALALPLLRRDLGETNLSTGEKAMLADVEKRVRNWDQMLPFYSDEKYGEGKEIESRNAESVLNAVILASYDAGKPELTDLARLAFDHAWALQSKTGPDAGAWVWQDFGYAPWESKESQYHWAALMAIAVAQAPGNYQNDPRVSPQVDALKRYLKNRYAEQPLLNKVVALWATKCFPELISAQQQQALLGMLYTLQGSEGGWSLTALGTWKRRDNTPLETRPDGYATGLITLVLEETARKGDQKAQDHIRRSIDWLNTNQDRQTGSWPAWSLNKNRDLQSDAGLFMTDAATAYAVLALENPGR